MEPIRVVLGFDMETDSGSWSPFYEGLNKGTPKILELLAAKDVTATCFFTGEAAHRFPGIVADVAAAGHEVGAHSLYHETVGDPLFDIPGIHPLLPEEVPLRLRRATEYVAESLGHTPVSFRCPRLWGSTAVVNALADLGYIADASYPLYFYGGQYAPYYPDADDWTRKGTLPLLEIPNFADMTIDSQDPYGRDRDQWPLFRTESADALLRHIDNFIRDVRERGLPVVLCFYFHPWEFVPMPPQFTFGEGTTVPDPFLLKNCGSYALQQLGLLIDALKARNCEFMTAAALAEAWRQRSDET